MIFPDISQGFTRFSVRILRHLSATFDRAANTLDPVQLEKGGAATIVATSGIEVSARDVYEAEILAMLDGLCGDNDDAKIPTISTTAERPQAQVLPDFAIDGAGDCVVASSTPTYIPIPEARPIPMWERLCLNPQSPLYHLFGPAGGPFVLSSYTPAVLWSRSTEQQKFEQGIRSAQSRKGVAITCNLSPARERALLNSKSPVETLSAMISRWLKRLLGFVPPYAFQFEFNHLGRLHIHGVVLLDRADEAELGKLKEALAAGCGKIDGKPGSRQLKLAELYNADGWTGYFSKTVTGTVKRLGVERVTFMSDGLRRFAREDWTAAHVAARRSSIAA